jgi:hypothetical protein
MLSVLASKPVQRFILEHEHEDENALVLKNKTLFDLPPALIANQIACRRKAKAKLPLWYNNSGIIYPKITSLEQTSSEITAQYKHELLTKLLPAEAGRLHAGADLTGGFGVDSFFISRLVNFFHYAEPDAELVELAKHNHQLLGNTSITYQCARAEEFLTTFNELLDFIYLDPSRRKGFNKKVFRLTDCSPDATKLLPALLAKAGLVLIKTSPLLDIQRGLIELKSVSDVFVVSVANECKEVLFLCRAGFSGEPLIHAVNLLSTDGEFTFRLSEEKEASVTYSDPLTYLYEPNASLLKAGAFKSIASAFGLMKLHRHTHLYTSDKPVNQFPGRVFNVNALISQQSLLQHFPSKQVNIICRNYPLSPDELKKKFKLRDGGPDYLIAATCLSKKYLLAANRVQ